MKKVFSFYLFLVISAGLPAQEGNLHNGKSVKYISGKDTVQGYLSVPSGEGPFPGLIIIHEWWGLDDWIKSNTDMFASEGYAALAVDLYRGKTAGSPEEAHEIMRALPEDRAVKDLKSAYQYLNTLDNVDKENIGSIGWCMGGSYSLAAAMSIPKLDACVICYGRLVTEEESLEKIKSPVLGIFGEEDRGIPASDVRTFESALKEKGNDIRIIIYPGVGHAFMNPNNKQGHNSETSDAAWKEIKSFLQKELK